ncbi:acyltransferase [Harenicola maris]
MSDHSPLSLFLWAIGAGWRRARNRGATLMHRACLAQMGRGTRIYRRVSLTPPGRVHIGADCFLAQGVSAADEGGTGSLTLMDGVHINADVTLDMTGGLTIEHHALISAEAIISTHDHGRDPRSAPRPMPKVIGARAWIGTRAMILPQCQNIGADAVIGAGAVVTRDVPAGAVVAGNPARIIGTTDTIAKQVA